MNNTTNARTENRTTPPVTVIEFNTETILDSIVDSHRSFCFSLSVLDSLSKFGFLCVLFTVSYYNDGAQSRY